MRHARDGSSPRSRRDAAQTPNNDSVTPIRRCCRDFRIACTIRRGRTGPVTPSARAGDAPSDAIVPLRRQSLVDLDATKQPWKVENGYVEVVPNGGDLRIEGNVRRRAAARRVGGAGAGARHSQNRGNSGIFLQGRYEVQVLDSFENPTYADGQAGAFYGQWPPLVNPRVNPAMAVLRHRVRSATLRRQQR